MGEQAPEPFVKELSSKMPEPKTVFLRGKGLTVYFVFREVAQAGNMPRGFVMESGPKQVTVPEAIQVVDFYLKQGKSVQEHGIWLIGADAKGYAEEDRQMELKLKELCRQKGIPLLKTRIKDFPEGWQLFS